MSTVDFIGIGVQKSASTWLWANLNAHPDVWLPPRKELHYFDRSLNYPSPSFLATDHIVNRLFSLQPHNKLFRKKAYEEIRLAYIQKDMPRLKWLLRYYLKNYNDQWYLSLFPDRQNYLKGEITPAYSILHESDIRHIKDILPDVKIILTLRDPVDRAWSQVKFYKTREIHNVKLDEQKLIEFIESPRQTMRNDYVTIVKTWKKIFGKQLYIGYYDEIIEDPKSYLNKIYHFLGISSHHDVFIKNRINVSKEITIPPNILDFLYQKYYQDIVTLQKMLDSPYLNHWITQLSHIDSKQKSIYESP